jgi:hypothetical protein
MSESSVVALRRLPRCHGMRDQVQNLVKGLLQQRASGQELLDRPDFGLQEAVGTFWRPIILHSVTHVAATPLARFRSVSGYK